MPNKRKRTKFRPNWYSKSAYARKIGKSPTHVQNMIDEGLLEVIAYDKGEIIVLPLEVVAVVQVPKQTCDNPTK